MNAYHGTESSFDVFDPACGGKMMGVRTPYLFFTSNVNNALFYGPLVLLCDLKLTTPYIVEGDEARRYKPALWAKKVLQANRANGVHYDGVILRDVLDGCEYSDIYIVFDPQQVAIIQRLDYRD